MERRRIEPRDDESSGSFSEDYEEGESYTGSSYTGSSYVSESSSVADEEIREGRSVIEGRSAVEGSAYDNSFALSENRSTAGHSFVDTVAGEDSFVHDVSASNSFAPTASHSIAPPATPKSNHHTLAGATFGGLVPTGDESKVSLFQSDLEDSSTGSEGRSPGVEDRSFVDGKGYENSFALSENRSTAGYSFADTVAGEDSFVRDVSVSNTFAPTASHSMAPTTTPKSNHHTLAGATFGGLVPPGDESKASIFQSDSEDSSIGSEGRSPGVEERSFVDGKGYENSFALSENRSTAGHSFADTGAGEDSFVRDVSVSNSFAPTDDPFSPTIPTSHHDSFAGATFDGMSTNDNKAHLEDSSPKVSGATSDEDYDDEQSYYSSEEENSDSDLSNDQNPHSIKELSISIDEESTVNEVPAALVSKAGSTGKAIPKLRHQIRADSRNMSIKSNDMQKEDSMWLSSLAMNQSTADSIKQSPRSTKPKAQSHAEPSIWLTDLEQGSVATPQHESTNDDSRKNNRGEASNSSCSSRSGSYSSRSGSYSSRSGSYSSRSGSYSSDDRSDYDDDRSGSRSYSGTGSNFEEQAGHHDESYGSRSSRPLSSQGSASSRFESNHQLFENSERSAASGFASRHNPAERSGRHESGSSFKGSEAKSEVADRPKPGSLPSHGDLSVFNTAESRRSLSLADGSIKNNFSYGNESRHRSNQESLRRVPQSPATPSCRTLATDAYDSFANETPGKSQQNGHGSVLSKLTEGPDLSSTSSKQLSSTVHSIPFQMDAKVENLDYVDSSIRSVPGVAAFTSSANEDVSLLSVLQSDDGEYADGSESEDTVTSSSKTVDSSNASAGSEKEQNTTGTISKTVASSNSAGSIGEREQKATGTVLLAQQQSLVEGSNTGKNTLSFEAFSSHQRSGSDDQSADTFNQSSGTFVVQSIDNGDFDDVASPIQEKSSSNSFGCFHKGDFFDSSRASAWSSSHSTRSASRGVVAMSNHSRCHTAKDNEETNDSSSSGFQSTGEFNSEGTDGGGGFDTSSRDAEDSSNGSPFGSNGEPSCSSEGIPETEANGGQPTHFVTDNEADGTPLHSSETTSANGMEIEDSIDKTNSPQEFNGLCTEPIEQAIEGSSVLSEQGTSSRRDSSESTASWRSENPSIGEVNAGGSSHANFSGKVSSAGSPLADSAVFENVSFDPIDSHTSATIDQTRDLGGDTSFRPSSCSNGNSVASSSHDEDEASNGRQSVGESGSNESADPFFVSDDGLPSTSIDDASLNSHGGSSTASSPLAISGDSSVEYNDCEQAGLDRTDDVQTQRVLDGDGATIDHRPDFTNKVSYVENSNSGTEGSFDHDAMSPEHAAVEGSRSRTDGSLASSSHMADDRSGTEGSFGEDTLDQNLSRGGSISGTSGTFGDDPGSSEDGNVSGLDSSFQRDSAAAEGESVSGTDGSIDDEEPIHHSPQGSISGSEGSISRSDGSFGDDPIRLDLSAQGSMLEAECSIPTSTESFPNDPNLPAEGSASGSDDPFGDSNQFEDESMSGSPEDGRTSPDLQRKSPDQNSEEESESVEFEDDQWAESNGSKSSEGSYSQSSHSVDEAEADSDSGSDEFWEDASKYSHNDSFMDDDFTENTFEEDLGAAERSDGSEDDPTFDHATGDELNKESKLVGEDGCAIEDKDFHQHTESGTGDDSQDQSDSVTDDDPPSGSASSDDFQSNSRAFDSHSESGTDDEFPAVDFDDVEHYEQRTNNSVSPDTSISRKESIRKPEVNTQSHDRMIRQPSASSNDEDIYGDAEAEGEESPDTDKLSKSTHKESQQQDPEGDDRFSNGFDAMGFPTSSFENNASFVSGKAESITLSQLGAVSKTEETDGDKDEEEEEPKSLRLPRPKSYGGYNREQIAKLSQKYRCTQEPEDDDGGRSRRNHDRNQRMLGKSESLLSLVANVDDALVTLEKIQREQEEADLTELNEDAGGEGEGQEKEFLTPGRLVYAFEVLVGILLELSDELELLQTFSSSRDNAAIDSLTMLLSQVDVIDEKFATLKPILHHYHSEEIDEELDDFLYGMNLLVDLMCELCHQVATKHNWSAKANTSFTTMLELLARDTLEVKCIYEDVDTPEYHLTYKIQDAWEATGHVEEVKTLLVTSDLFMFRQICYEVMLSTDRWCPNNNTLMDICGVDDDSQDRVEPNEDDVLSPPPEPALQILEKIHGTPIPRTSTIASVLRRILPAQAISDPLVSESFARIRNTVRNPLGLPPSSLVTITSLPESIDDPDALGVAGIGKSTIAAMVANHDDVRRFFNDGIAWLYVGETELTYNRYIQCLQDLLAQLEVDEEEEPLFPELLHCPGESFAVRRRREEGFMIYLRETMVEFLRNRNVLIVLDDVCFEPDLDWFDFAPAPSPDQPDDEDGCCAMLVTTRRRTLLPPADTVEVDMMEETEASELLIKESGDLAHFFSDGPTEVASVVLECACHPLTTKSVGRWLNLKHATAIGIGGEEDDTRLREDVSESMHKILTTGFKEDHDMLYSILQMSLSPTINGEPTTIIKFCFAAFVRVFCERKHISDFALADSTPIVPLATTVLLFGSLLNLEEESLKNEGSLFFTKKDEAAVLIPEALSALGVFKVIVTYAEGGEDEEEEEEDEKYIQIMHRIQQEYGEYIYEDDETLTDLMKDGERRWNESFSRSVLCMNIEWDAEAPDASVDYALEMLPSHLLRGGMLTEAAELLCDERFAKGRLFALGRENGTRRQIKDCESLFDLMAEQRSKGNKKTDMRATIQSAYDVLGGLLKMDEEEYIQEEGSPEAVEVGRCHFELGFSLAEKRCWEGAISHWESSQEFLVSSLGMVELVAGILFNVGVVYSEMHEYDQALSSLKQCLRIRGAIHGEEHILYAQTIQKIGDVFLAMSDYHEAMESYNWALDVMHIEPSHHRISIGDILEQMGNIHYSKGEIKLSLQSYQDGLRSKQVDLGEDHPELASLFHHIGNCLSNLGRTDEAIAHLEEAVRLKELDPDGGPERDSDVLTIQGILDNLNGMQQDGLRCYEHALQILITKVSHRKEKVASLLHLIGCVYLMSGEHKKSMKLFEESLHARRKVLGFVHLDVASTLFNMAFLHQTRNRLDKALKCLEEALKIRQLRLPNSEKVAVTHEKIGNLARGIGKTKKAENAFEEALIIRKRIHGNNHEAVATVLQELGDLMDDLGNYEDAMRHYVEALEIRESRLGPDDLAVAETYYSMGFTLQNNGALDRALQCLEESLSIRKFQLGDDAKEVGDTLNMMGFLQAKRGELDDALSLLWDALRIRKLQDDHIKVSETLNNIGNVHREKQEFDLSLECYEECVRIRREELGDSSEKVADALIAIGNVHSDMNYPDEAMDSYKEALAIRNMLFGEQDESVATVLQYMGTLEFRANELDRAYQLLDEFIRIRQENGTEPDGDYVNVLFMIGNIHKMQENEEDAKKCWTEAYGVFKSLGLAETNPQIAEVMSNLVKDEDVRGGIDDDRQRGVLDRIGAKVKRAARTANEAGNAVKKVTGIKGQDRGSQLL